MSLSIRPLTATGFAGEVSGIDLTQPLSRDQVTAIDDGMDQFGVLVFHDQRFDDETQLAFSLNFGDLEVSSGAEMSKAPGPAAGADGNGGRFEFGSGWTVAGRVGSHAADGFGQPSVALGRIVQGGAREVFVAVGADRAGDRRQYGIR